MIFLDYNIYLHLSFSDTATGESPFSFADLMQLPLIIEIIIKYLGCFK